MKSSPFQTLIHLENAVQSSPDIQLCMGQGHDVLEQEQMNRLRHWCMGNFGVFVSCALGAER